MPRLVGYWLHPVMLCWRGCQLAASVSELIYIGALVQLYCSRTPQQVAHLTLACILAGFCKSIPPGFDADLWCLGALSLASVAPRVAALHLILLGPVILLVTWKDHVSCRFGSYSFFSKSVRPSVSAASKKAKPQSLNRPWFDHGFQDAL